MIVAISGGTGSAKLVRALYSKAGDELTVIANVGDNIILHGLLVCPDIDTITYALSMKLDVAKGWGVDGDTFNFLTELSKHGLETWFKIGDRDLATHVHRTYLLHRGHTLSEITQKIASALHVKAKILPATNDYLETMVDTTKGEMHFQEFWVKRRGRIGVKNVRYDGADRSRPAPGVVEAIDNASVVVLPPANPITSIGPTLSIQGIGDSLERTKARKIAVSPMIGSSPVSGPADKLMRAVGVEASPLGVAKLYSDFLDDFIIDSSDEVFVAPIEALGIRVHRTNILLNTPLAQRRLASYVLKLGGSGY